LVLLVDTIISTDRQYTMKIDATTNTLMNRITQAARQTPQGADGGPGPQLSVSPDQQLPDPAVVYHPGMDDGSSSLPTYAPGSIQVWKFDHEAYERDEQEMRELQWGGFGASAAEMRRGYDAAAMELSPELMAKDWGFSIKNKALVIVEGNDILSDAEVKTLKNALRELKPAANQLAEDVLRYLELDRGTDGLSKRLGRFDVSQQNFSDVIDMRELLMSVGENGKYGQSYRNQSDYVGLYKVSTSYALADQMEARAEARFLATSQQMDYTTRVY
jgi:hypothetical protein